MQPKAFVTSEKKMKRNASFLLSFIFLTTGSYAQTLNKVADLLFKNVKIYRVTTTAVIRSHGIKSGQKNGRLYKAVIYGVKIYFLFDAICFSAEWH